MSKSIILNTEGKEKILKTLLAFKHEGTFERINIRTYECAEQLAEHSKSNLETSKADIESYIDRQRTAAAFLAVLGIIVSRVFVPSPFLEFGVVVFFAAISALIFVDVEKKVFWLHIIKIAIAQKSEQ